MIIAYMTCSLVFFCLFVRDCFGCGSAVVPSQLVLGLLTKQANK
jgi:hypothetical protein